MQTNHGAHRASCALVPWSFRAFISLQCWMFDFFWKMTRVASPLWVSLTTFAVAPHAAKNVPRLDLLAS